MAPSVVFPPSIGPTDLVTEIQDLVSAQEERLCSSIGTLETGLPPEQSDKPHGLLFAKAIVDGAKLIERHLDALPSTAKTLTEQHQALEELESGNQSARARLQAAVDKGKMQLLAVREALGVLVRARHSVTSNASLDPGGEADAGDFDACNARGNSESVPCAAGRTESQTQPLALTDDEDDLPTAGGSESQTQPLALTDDEEQVDDAVNDCQSVAGKPSKRRAAVALPEAP